VQLENAEDKYIILKQWHRGRILRDKIINNIFLKIKLNTLNIESYRKSIFFILVWSNNNY